MIRVLTTVAELMVLAARCRGVTWVGNRVEKQIKNHCIGQAINHQYMILSPDTTKFNILFKCAP